MSDPVYFEREADDDVRCIALRALSQAERGRVRKMVQRNADRFVSSAAAA